MRQKETLQLMAIYSVLDRMGAHHIISLIVEHFFIHISYYKRYGEEIIKIGDKFRSHIPFHLLDDVRYGPDYQMILKDYDIRTRSVFTDMSVVDSKLQKVNLVDLKFYEKYFRNSNFRNCTISKCTFNDVKFQWCNLKGVTFVDCSFDTTFENCDMEDVHFLYCNFAESVFQNTMMTNVKFTESIFFHIHLSSCILKKCCFTKCSGRHTLTDDRSRRLEYSLEKVIFFADVTLNQSVFDRCLFYRDDFNMDKSIVDECVFMSSVFSGGSFTECRILETGFTESSLNSSDFDYSDIVESSFEDCDFEMCNFRGVLINRCYFVEGNFNCSDFRSHENAITLIETSSFVKCYRRDTISQQGNMLSDGLECLSDVTFEGNRLTRDDFDI